MAGSQLLGGISFLLYFLVENDSISSSAFKGDGEHKLGVKFATCETRDITHSFKVHRRDTAGAPVSSSSNY
jgi:hypothetical protein